MRLPGGTGRSLSKNQPQCGSAIVIARNRYGDNHSSQSVCLRIVSVMHSHGMFDNSVRRAFRARENDLLGASPPCRRFATIALYGNGGSSRQARSYAHPCGTTGNPMISLRTSILRGMIRIATPRVDRLMQILLHHDRSRVPF